MVSYICAQIVDATLMTRGEYSKEFGVYTPKDQDPEDEGYLVTNSAFNLQTWVPKHIFEESSSEIGELPYLLPYQERMLGEQAYLRNQLKKITSATRKKTFLSMPHAERELLLSQSRAMQRYYEFLSERIESFLPAEE